MKMKMLKVLLVGTIGFFACVTAYYCFFSSCRQILVSPDCVFDASLVPGNLSSMIS